VPFEDIATATDAGLVHVFYGSSSGITTVGNQTISQNSGTIVGVPESGDNFGTSVSINGDYIVIGSDYKDKDEVAVDAGSAYLFKRNSDISNDVIQIAKIVASDAEKNDYFGASVSIAGDYIVVGAQEEDTNALGTGSAYVFKRNTDGLDDITQIAKIQSSNILYNMKFGHSVFISEDDIIVGAYSENSAETSTGGAYLFKRDTNQGE